MSCQQKSSKKNKTKQKKKQKTAAKFASQSDAHVRTDAQIKFLYYPLTRDISFN